MLFTNRAIPPLEMRTIIVPHGMGVEHLSGIECVVTGILKPHGEVVLIVTILYKNWKSAFEKLKLSSQRNGQDSPYGGFKSVTLVL